MVAMPPAMVSGVGLKVAPVGDAPLAAARIVGVHAVGAPAEGADREAAADDLAQRGEVRSDAEALLRAATAHPERDDLVEDQEDVQALGDLAQLLEEAL